MISRYARITQTGMNKIFQDEDGAMVAVNDVAKALSTIGVELYNTETGFTDLWDILIQVNEQWDSMDDAQRNYISTTFAGTRQMNRFVAMMENFDMVLELYKGSLDSAGLAAEKYSIWQESATAAQNNFNAALENLYASFIEGGVIADFYNTLADVINVIAKGLNTGLSRTVIAVGAVVAVLGGAGSVVATFVSSLMKTVSAFAAVTTGAGTASVAVGALGTTIKLSVPIIALLSVAVVGIIG